MDNNSFTSAVERAKAIAQRFAESAGVSAGPTTVPTPTSNPSSNSTSNKRPAEDDDDFVNKRISSDIASKIQDFRNAFNSGTLGPSGGNGSGPTGSNGSSNSAGPTVPKLGEGPPLLSGMICNGEKHLDMLIPGNKIGLVIGKGGENIRNLQDKAGVRMTIFQQSHDASEPEKLLRISGPPDKVDRGRELVLEVTEREPRSSNSFGGGGSGGGNSGPPGGYSDYGPRPGGGGGNRPGLGSGNMGGRSNDGNTIEVSVPPAFIGLVIGKGGESIKRIQHESGAKVQFDTNKTDSRGNKICAISGSDHSVKRAEDMIQEIIDNAVATRGNGGGGGGGNRSNERSGGPSMNPFDGPAETVRYPVPSNRCGAVIGRGGETIRQIKQQSGCDIELDKVSKAMGGDEKIFIIRGPSDRIALAKQLINEKVGKGGNASPAPDLPPGALGTSSGDYSWSNYWQAEHGIPPSAEANPMLAASQVGGGGASGSAGDNSSWDAYYAQYFSQLAAAGGAPNSANANGSNANDAAAAGGQDYTQQWIEYYRAYGMHKEAEQIEQMAKARKSSGGPSDHSKNQQASLASSVTQTVAYPGFNYSSYTQQK